MNQAAPRCAQSQASRPVVGSRECSVALWTRGVLHMDSSMYYGMSFLYTRRNVNSPEDEVGAIGRLRMR